MLLIFQYSLKLWKVGENIYLLPFIVALIIYITAHINIIPNLHIFISIVAPQVSEQCPCDHTGRLCSLEAHPQSPKNVIFDAKLRPHFVCADSFQISGNKKRGRMIAKG